MSNIIEITGSHFPVIDQGGILVLLDIYSTTCGPCTMLAPVLVQLAHKHSHTVLVAKAESSANRELIAQYKVMSVPTLILFKDGVEIGRSIGFQTLEQLEAKFGLTLNVQEEENNGN